MALVVAATFVAAAAVVLYLAAVKSVPAPATRFPATQPAASSGGTYFLGGRVQRPGAYTMAGQPASIRQAILAAGGADGPLGPRAYVTVHRKHPGEEEIIKVNLRPLLEGGVNDEALWPNDSVMVHDKQ